ncbi:unnamed protein product, partial [Meganyctiphanes norvegica]
MRRRISLNLHADYHTALKYFEQVLDVRGMEDFVVDVSSLVRHWEGLSGHKESLVASIRPLHNHQKHRHTKNCHSLSWSTSLMVSWKNDSACTNENNVIAPIREKETATQHHVEKSYDNSIILSRNQRSLFPSISNGHKKMNKGRKFPKGKRPCSLKPLHVDFSEIGWDSWVIAPSGYNAGACGGKCVFPMHTEMAPTNHAVVSAIHASLIGRGKPCCVAKDLKPITMIYYDYNNNIVLKQYPDMVATSCGCR